jgi:hypothetical protein
MPKGRVMLLTKAILLIANQLFLIGALVALILYVRKTSEIAESSEASTKALKKTTAASLNSAELSRQVLAEMKETRSLLTASLVVAYFERGTGERVTYLFFILENVGKGVARDVKFSFSPELWSHDIESVERIKELSKGVDSLPPNYRLKNLFGRAGYYIDVEGGTGEGLNADAPRQFEVTVDFQDAVTDEPHSEKYFLDLGVPLGRCAQ